MGKLHNERSHADARRAALLKAEGHTTREIAKQLAIEPKQVRGRILLGERLLSDQPAKGGAE